MQTEGERINLILKELKLSRQDIANLFGCTDKYIGNVINNVKKLSRERLHSLLIEYGVNINYVLEGEGEMFINSQDKNELILSQLEEQGIEIILRKKS